MRPFGWVGAAMRGIAVLIVLVVLLVIVPNVLVTKLNGLGRSARVAAATVWFTAAMAGIAWGLRRLQARRVI